MRGSANGSGENESESGPKYSIFIPNNINPITIIATLKCIEKINTEKKMTTKHSEKYFSHQRCEEANTIMASRF